MARPPRAKIITGKPKATFYKPQRIPLRTLEVCELTLEEFEALRLKYDLGHNQTKAASLMDTSQSTFQRILTSALAKVGNALVSGKAIKINYTQS
jgi:predicted DNA-binding protein (UPF0251 family)